MLSLLGAELQGRSPQRVERSDGRSGMQQKDDDGDVVGAKVEGRRVQGGHSPQLAQPIDARVAAAAGVV